MRTCCIALSNTTKYRCCCCCCCSGVAGPTAPGGVAVVVETWIVWAPTASIQTRAEIKEKGKAVIRKVGLSQPSNCKATVLTMFASLLALWLHHGTRWRPNWRLTSATATALWDQRLLGGGDNFHSRTIRTRLRYHHPLLRLRLRRNEVLLRAHLYLVRLRYEMHCLGIP